jgi:hypothetical protein
MYSVDNNDLTMLDLFNLMTDLLIEAQKYNESVSNGYWILNKRYTSLKERVNFLNKCYTGTVRNI